MQISHVIIKIPHAPIQLSHAVVRKIHVSMQLLHAFMRILHVTIQIIHVVVRIMILDMRIMHCKISLSCHTHLFQYANYVFFCYSIKMAFDRCDKDTTHFHRSRTNHQLFVHFGGVLPRAESFAGKNESEPFVIFVRANNVHHDLTLSPSP